MPRRFNLGDRLQFGADLFHHGSTFVAFGGNCGRCGRKTQRESGHNQRLWNRQYAIGIYVILANNNNTSFSSISCWI